MRSVWLVGESNPYSRDPDHALVPYPPGCAGARLLSHLGLAEADYLRLYRRANLVAAGPGWDAGAARAAANALLSGAAEGDVFVLLGRRVSAAFSRATGATALVPWEFRDPRVTGPDGHMTLVRLLSFPHPSGRSRAWNDPDATAHARALLRTLVGPGYAAAPRPRARRAKVVPDG